MASAPFLRAVIFTPTEYNGNRFQFVIAFLLVSYNSHEIFMKTQNHAGRLVAKLREIIGKSQSQFATMIGVSKHSIISIENGRTKELSRNLTKRIEIATGADLLGGKLESPFAVANYTRNDFDRWREKYGQTNKSAALKQFSEINKWMKVLFLAAAKSGRAGNRDRLPAVSLALAEWLDEARVNFKLEDEIEDILDEEEPLLKTVAHVISALLDDPNRSQKDLAEHDIDFNKIKHELRKQASDGFLFIQDEYRSTWGPGRIPFSVLRKPRTRLPQAKYWIKHFKGSLADLQKTGFSHSELSKYIIKLNENPAFAESEARQNSPQVVTKLGCLHSASTWPPFRLCARSVALNLHPPPRQTFSQRTDP